MQGKVSSEEYSSSAKATCWVARKPARKKWTQARSPAAGCWRWCTCCRSVAPPCRPRWGRSGGGTAAATRCCPAERIRRNNHLLSYYIYDPAQSCMDFEKQGLRRLCHTHGSRCPPAYHVRHQPGRQAEGLVGKRPPQPPRRPIPPPPPIPLCWPLRRHLRRKPLPARVPHIAAVLRLVAAVGRATGPAGQRACHAERQGGDIADFGHIQEGVGGKGKGVEAAEGVDSTAQHPSAAGALGKGVLVVKGRFSVRLCSARYSKVYAQVCIAHSTSRSRMMREGVCTWSATLHYRGHADEEGD